jgi:hypothetical protein
VTRCVSVCLPSALLIVQHRTQTTRCVRSDLAPAHLADTAA